jgi:hypothetical protein
MFHFTITPYVDAISVSVLLKRLKHGVLVTDYMELSTA